MLFDHASGTDATKRVKSVKFLGAIIIKILNKKIKNEKIHDTMHE
jgi:hypothetical protein